MLLAYRRQSVLEDQLQFVLLETDSVSYYTLELRQPVEANLPLTPTVEKSQ